RGPDLGVLREDVGLSLRVFVLLAPLGARGLHREVAAVAVAAAEAHGGRRVHRLLVRLRVAGDAAGALAVGFLLRLLGERGLLGLALGRADEGHEGEARGGEDGGERTTTDAVHGGPQ